MMSAADIHKLTSLSEDARKAAADVLDAISDWRDALSAANERYLTRVVDQMAVAQRAMGWPEHVSAATRDSILQASKAQTQFVDQIMDAWEQQLKSPGDATLLPQRFLSQLQQRPSLPLQQSASDPMGFGEMSAVPFKVWMQAADQWQRDWAALMSNWMGSNASRSGRDRM